MQIATKTIDEGIRAGLLAAEAGADWVDLNCGCPTYDATRRGLGAALLRKPKKLARLVGALPLCCAVLCCAVLFSARLVSSPPLSAIKQL